MLKAEKVEAQKVLDALVSENLLPFPLTAYRVDALGLQQYMIIFNDSRIGSVIVTWYEGLDFKDVCRTAILEKVKTYRCPLPYEGG
jgi:hypothetical protein